MNLQKIKEAVNSGLPDKTQEFIILHALAEDENVLPLLFRILEAERKQKKEVMEQLNILLGKAHIGLEEPEFNKDGFMQAEITEFYRKYSHVKGIGHCFKARNFFEAVPVPEKPDSINP